MNITYWFPFILIVSANICYHNIAKWMPITLPPFLALSITYLISFLFCAATYLYTGNSIRQDIHTLNWASFIWGIILVAIEFGYILLYRAGWKISLAPLLINVTGAILLSLIGVFFYKEILSLKQIIGILFCFLGLYLLH